MIHTVELLFPINYQEVQHLFAKYEVNFNHYAYFGGAVKQLKQCLSHESPAYSLTWLSCQGKGEWNLHVKVDILKILGRSNISERDYKLVEVDIHKFLIRQFAHSGHFDQHRLTRIDYRFDVVIPDKNNQKLLFHLFEKYTEKYGYKKKIKWGKIENGDPMKYETSQYHKSKSVEFIIYDKEEERKAKMTKGQNIEIEAYEKDVIRYELRLKNEHLNGMKRLDKGKGRPKKLKEYFKDDLYKEYMLKHILPIVRKGDYYKITRAEKIIENSHFTRKNKEKLRSFLVQISEKGIDAPKTSLSQPTYRKYLNDLETIGINPILIPKNRTDFPSYFQNPFQTLYQSYKPLQMIEN